MRNRLRCEGNGFTLIELLAVMSLIILMAAIVAGGYAGMVRGAAVRSSMQHLSSLMTEARQLAVVKGRKAYIVFEQEGSRLTNVSYMYIAMAEGISTSGSGGPILSDEYHDLAGLYDPSKGGAGIGTVVNLEYMENGEPAPKETRTIGYQCTTNGGIRLESVECEDAIWKGVAANTRGERYGWRLGRKQALPRGIVFVDTAGDPKCPPPIIVNDDGTVEDHLGIKPGDSGFRVLMVEKRDLVQQSKDHFVFGVAIHYLGQVETLYDI